MCFLTLQSSLRISLQSYIYKVVVTTNAFGTFIILLSRPLFWPLSTSCSYIDVRITAIFKQRRAIGVPSVGTMSSSSCSIQKKNTSDMLERPNAGKSEVVAAGASPVEGSPLSSKVTVYTCSALVAQRALFAPNRRRFSGRRIGNKETKLTPSRLSKASAVDAVGN